MTEEKKSKNPFVNMANEAKKNKPGFVAGKTVQQKAPKPSKGFGGATVVRRSGRGG
jgi:hypothetical protein